MATHQDVHAPDKLFLQFGLVASDHSNPAALQRPVATCLGPLIGLKDEESCKDGQRPSLMTI